MDSLHNTIIKTSANEKHGSNIQKIMIDRIFQNIKTTMVGVTSFLTGAIMVYLDKASLSEFGGFIGVAFAFFFAKDPKQKTND